MNHVELHELLSKALSDLEKDKINADKAKELFVGGSKLISNCKNEIKVIELGFEVDVPLMGIKKEEVKKKFSEAKEKNNEALMDKLRKKVKF